MEALGSRPAGVFLDDDPLGVAGERVELQLEDPLSRARAHGSSERESRERDRTRSREQARR